MIKNSRVRTLVARGAESMGYTLAVRTNCVETPISLYVHRDDQTLLIYKSGIKGDELIIVDYAIPAKLNVILNEYKGFSDACHQEIAAALEKILDGSFFREKNTVTYL